MFPNTPNQKNFLSGISGLTPEQDSMVYVVFQFCADPSSLEIVNMIPEGKDTLLQLYLLTLDIAFWSESSIDSQSLITKLREGLAIIRGVDVLHIPATRTQPEFNRREYPHVVEAMIQQVFHKLTQLKSSLPKGIIYPTCSSSTKPSASQHEQPPATGSSAPDSAIQADTRPHEPLVASEHQNLNDKHTLISDTKAFSKELNCLVTNLNQASQALLRFRCIIKQLQETEKLKQSIVSNILSYPRQNRQHGYYEGMEKEIGIAKEKTHQFTDEAIPTFEKKLLSQFDAAYEALGSWLSSKITAPFPPANQDLGTFITPDSVRYYERVYYRVQRFPGLKIPRHELGYHVILPTEIDTIWAKAQPLQDSSYLVGSSVLSILEQRPFCPERQDIDFVKIASKPIHPDSMLPFYHSHYNPRLYQTQIDGIRVECYQGASNLGLDAKGRDFSIASLYCNRNGIIFDPTGFGFTDLKHKILRTNKAPQTSLEESPVRILRAIKYITEGFKPMSSLEVAILNWYPDHDFNRQHFYSVLRKHLNSVGDKLAYVQHLENYGILHKVFGIFHLSPEASYLQLEIALNKNEAIDPRLPEIYNAHASFFYSKNPYMPTQTSQLTNSLDLAGKYQIIAM